MSRGAAFALVPSSHEDSLRWLRRKLAQVRVDGPPAQEPRPVSRWLSGALSVELDELQEGLSVVVRLVDGSAWIGDVRSVSETTLVLAPWGGSEMMITHDVIASCKVVPPHSWHERQVVAESQRRGEPAINWGVRDARR